MFNASRPDWPGLVRPGDIVVAGRNFGLGSSHPVPLLLSGLWVAAVAAEQFNSLFYRNCVNYGLLAITVPGVTKLVTEGDIVAIDAASGQLVNETTGARGGGAPLPAPLLEIVWVGGSSPPARGRGETTAQG